MITSWTRQDLLGVLVGPCERALATACRDLELEVVETEREVPVEDRRAVDEPVTVGHAEVAPRAVPRLRLRASAAARVDAAGAMLGTAMGRVNGAEATSKVVPARRDVEDVSANILPRGAGPEPSRAVPPTTVPSSAPLVVGVDERTAAVALDVSNIPHVSVGVVAPTGADGQVAPPLVNLARASTGAGAVGDTQEVDGKLLLHAPASLVVMSAMALRSASPVPHPEAAAPATRAAVASSHESPRAPQRRARVLERPRTARDVNVPLASLPEVDAPRASLPTPADLPELALGERGPVATLGAVPLASGSSTPRFTVIGAAESTRPVAAIDGPHVAVRSRLGEVAPPAAARPFAAFSAADPFAGLSSDLGTLATALASPVAVSASPAAIAASLAAAAPPVATPATLAAPMTLAAPVSPATAPATLAVPTSLAAPTSPMAAPALLASPCVPLAFTGASAARREPRNDGSFVPPTSEASLAPAPRVAPFGALARPSSSRSTEASPFTPTSTVDEAALAELLARAARRHGIEI